MTSTRKLAVITSLGWLLTYAFAKGRKIVRHRDSKLQRQQMTTWEGEGGNLPPPSLKQSNVALH